MFYLQYIWAKAAPGNKQEACRRQCAFLSLSSNLSLYLSSSLFLRHLWHRCSNKRSSLISPLPQYITLPLTGGPACMCERNSTHTPSLFLALPTVLSHTHAYALSEIKQITRASAATAVPAGGLCSACQQVAWLCVCPCQCVWVCVRTCACVCVDPLSDSHLQHRELISKTRKWHWATIGPQHLLHSPSRETGSESEKERVRVCACERERKQRCTRQVL